MAVAPQQVVSVAAATYPTDPQVNVPFEPDQFTFFNQAAAGSDVVISFDGVTDHGTLYGDTPLAALNWSTKQRKVWFRQRVAGAAISALVMAGTVI